MSVAPATNKGRADAQGLGHYLRPCCIPGTALLLGPCPPERPALPPGDIWTQAAAAAGSMSGFMVLLHLGSALMSVTHVATEAHKNHVLDYGLRSLSLHCPWKIWLPSLES